MDPVSAALAIGAGGSVFAAFVAAMVRSHNRAQAAATLAWQAAAKELRGDFAPPVPGWFRRR